MDYQRIYNDLIHSAQLRPDIPFLNGYTERHHIIPRSIGGSDDPENIVKLTAREHFVAHWLLWRIHKTEKMAHAFHMMCVGKAKKRYYNSRGFEEARKSMIETKKGKIFSQEHRAKLSAARMGKKPTAETRAKMGDKRRGKKHSAESIIKMKMIASKWRKSAWDHVEDIKALKLSGLTYKKIAAKYNCGIGVISRICLS